MTVDLESTDRCGTRVPSTRLLIVRLILYTILILPVPGYAGDLQLAFDSAKVVQEFDIGSDQLYWVGTSDSLVSLVLYNEDSSTVVVYDLEGRERFRYQTAQAKHAMIRRADLSENGQTLLVGHSFDMEGGGIRCFSLEHGERFYVSSGCWLQMSPNGEHFISNECEFGGEPRDILTNTGEARARIEGFYWGYRPVFVDDNRIAVVDGLDSMGIVDVDGSVLWKKHSPFGNQYHVAQIAMSRLNNLVAFYSQSLLVVCDLTGNELWRMEFDKSLDAVVFDERSPVAVVQGYHYQDKRGYTRILAAKTGQQIGDEFSQLRAETGHGIPGYGIEIDQGVLLIRGPRWSASYNRPGREEYWTAFFGWSDSTGMTGEQLCAEGAFYPLAGDENVLRFLRMKTTGNPVIVEVDRRVITGP